MQGPAFAYDWIAERGNNEVKDLINNLESPDRLEVFNQQEPAQQQG